MNLLFLFYCFFLRIRRPPRSTRTDTLFPYTTLFRSVLSVPLAIAAFLPLAGRRLTRVPLATWGMVIAHFGIAVALFGMASESAFSRERLAAIAIGGTEHVAARSEGRLGGKECGSTCISRGSPSH